MCKQCEIPVKEPSYDLQSEQGHPNMAYSMSGYTMAAGSPGGQKRKGETPMGGWYMFNGKSSVHQTGPQASRVVLQLHPELDLLHPGPVRASVRIPQRQLAVHWVLLLETV